MHTGAMTTTQTGCPSHPDSPADLSDHIGGKPCVEGKPSTARNLWDLPIFGAFWSAEAREVER